MKLWKRFNPEIIPCVNISSTSHIPVFNLWWNNISISAGFSISCIMLKILHMSLTLWAIEDIYSLNICNDDPTQLYLSVVFVKNINLKDIIIVTNKFIKYLTSRIFNCTVPWIINLLSKTLNGCLSCLRILIRLTYFLLLRNSTGRIAIAALWLIGWVMGVVVDHRIKCANAT